MSYDKITIIINTFKSEDKIHQCIDSIASKVKVIVIENSDNINLKKELENKYNNIQCFLTGKNLGYAKGNNLGISKVKSEYALVLNPDAILASDALDKLLNTANKLSDFAIIGPAKQNEFSKFDLNKNEDQVFQVDSLKGFAMLLNLDQFKDTGFFDENFFIYLEEIDLCKRLKKNSKKIYLDKNVVIHHLGGSSHNEIINYEMELSRNWHWMWSTFYFHYKHYGYLIALLKVFKNLLSTKIKFFYYLITLNTFKRKIYQMRLLGLISSMRGKNSYYRANL